MHIIAPIASQSDSVMHSGVPPLDFRELEFEVPQLSQYTKGQRFVLHRDYEPSQRRGPQRVATVLIYLNDVDPEDGGGTVFAVGNSPDAVVSHACTDTNRDGVCCEGLKGLVRSF